MQYRLMKSGEETVVCELVNRVFDQFVAPHFVPEGVREFQKYADPKKLYQRTQANHFVLVAVTADKIVGVIEVRDYDHVSLLFVDRQFQGQSISRKLLIRALKICREHKPDLRKVEVNSSPNAVLIYQRLDFHQTSSEQVVNGIRFVPMVLELWPVKFRTGPGCFYPAGCSTRCNHCPV